MGLSPKALQNGANALPGKKLKWVTTTDKSNPILLTKLSSLCVTVGTEELIHILPISTQLAAPQKTSSACTKLSFVSLHQMSRVNPLESMAKLKGYDLKS